MAETTLSLDTRPSHHQEQSPGLHERVDSRHSRGALHLRRGQHGPERTRRGTRGLFRKEASQPLRGRRGRAHGTPRGKSTRQHEPVGRVGETAAGVAGGDTDGRDAVEEDARRAREAIERRLAAENARPFSSSGRGPRESDDKVSAEATALLAHLKSIMWDNVGVVRTPSKLATAVSELTAIRDRADRLWEEARGAGWEVVALRDAAHAGLAVAEAASANRVAGGAHSVVPDEGEEADGSATTEEAREQDSDDDEDSFVAARV